MIVTDRLRWRRSGGQPLETVGAVADFDHATGALTVHTNSLSFTSYLFMVAGTMRIPANKLDIRPRTGRRQLRLEAVRHQTRRDRRDVLARGRPARAVPRGPRRQHLQLRPPRLRPRLRGAAGDDARRHDPRHRHRHRRRLRRLHPVRGRPPRQRARAGRRAVRDDQRAVPGAGGDDEQEPAGRLPGLRLRGQQLDARADGGQGRPRARPRPRRHPAAQLHPRVPALHPHRQRLRLR